MESIPRPIRLIPFVILNLAFAIWLYNAVPSFFMHRLEDGPSSYTNPVVWCMDTDSQDWRVAKITDTSNSDMWSIFLHRKAENVVQGDTVISDCKVQDEFGNATFWLVVSGLAQILVATVLSFVFFTEETIEVMSSPLVWGPLAIIAFIAFVFAAAIAVMIIATVYAAVIMLGILGVIAATST